MANFSKEGNKTVKCRCGNLSSVPLNDTIFKCPSCDSYVVVRYFGTIVDNSGNNIF